MPCNNIPIFSIIIPVFNIDTTYLDICVKSILSQSFSQFELILVDDGSLDPCRKFCDAYAHTDPRIKVIHQENKGVSVARNVGIASALADWIWFIDGDDWIEPDALSLLHHYLKENPNIDILQFHALSETETGHRRLEYGLQENHTYDFSLPEERVFLYRRVIGISVDGRKYSSPEYFIWDKVFRRSFLLEHDLSYPQGIVKSEDKIFVSRCFRKAAYLRVVPEILYHYRQNEQSVCHRYSANLSKNRIELARVLYPLAKQMDADLADMLNDPSFHVISDDYQRFMFGIITDILSLQFYHKDNPNPRTRRKDALSFLNTEPFRSCIRNIPYSSLATPAKLKKFLLRYGFVSTFYTLNKFLKKE